MSNVSVGPLTFAPLKASSAANSDFAVWSRPALARLLRGCKLDVTYHRALGDIVWTHDIAGEETAVLDMVGGFGVGLLGHNHPDLVSTLQQALDANVPFHVQGSDRVRAGSLARMLAGIVRDRTGFDTVVTLMSTGAEAVEGALKHARLEYARRRNAALAPGLIAQRRLAEQSRNAEARYIAGAPTMRAEASKRIAELNRYNAEVAGSPPLILALRNSFHGKTTGSLRLTYNAELREPFGADDNSVLFLPANDMGALHEVLAAYTKSIIVPRFTSDGSLVEERASFSNFGAIFAEPIQGEGGILELEIDFLQALREAADEHGCPLVFDEIQSGCGRTGTFLASERAGVSADYYLLSKALGGGLVKIAALMVRLDRYSDEFGHLHTSTFGDDELSSAVSAKAVELIISSRSALMRRAEVRGEELMRGLRSLQARYPRVIRDVRGRGLMLGVELASQDASASPVLRLLSAQKRLGFAVAGYLLHRQRIRVLPTMSQPWTLRLEPSALLNDDQVDWFLSGFERTCTVLRDADVAALLSYLPDAPSGAAAAGESDTETATHQADYPTTGATGSVLRHPPDAHVAFLGYFSLPSHVPTWEPRLRGFAQEQLGDCISRLQNVLSPFVVDTVDVESIQGSRVRLTCVALPYTAELIRERFREGDIRHVEAQIAKAIDLAHESGARLVGLGGYLSAITQQGSTLAEPRVGTTSGNALTVGMGWKALMHAAADRGIDPSRAHLGVVGANGSICRLWAELATAVIPRLTLIGRKGSESRLRRLADQLGRTAHVSISTDVSALRDCDLIVSASNSPEPVIEPNHLGSGPRVICDIAVPADTSSAVASLRPDVHIIRGGLVALPRNHDLAIAGLPLERGCVYACLAETLLLGLEGKFEHFGFGTVRLDHVRRVMALAAKHGFDLARPSLDHPL